VVNRLKIPQGLSTLMFHQWSEVPSREESVVIHRKKNYQLYKDATVSGHVISLMLLFIILFSVLFSFALLLLSLHILPFMAFSVAFLMFYQVLFHDCVVFQEHHSSLSAAFPGCFVGLFCPVLLGGCFLALCRAPISSDRFFIWHPLRPSSTQLLNCS